MMMTVIIMITIMNRGHFVFYGRWDLYKELCKLGSATLGLMCFLVPTYSCKENELTVNNPLLT